ncbi:MAG: siderophore-interacting protein [Nocardioides sp.]
MTLAPAERPFLLCATEVVRAERLSPSFVRVHLAAPELAELGSDGPTYDQRIKLVFPDGDGPLPTFSDGEDWYAEWLARPQAERGHMRTYTVRDVLGSGVDTRLVVDLVVHGVDGHGEAGPGSRWAAAARPGSRVGLVGPRRGMSYGGIEFVPPAGAELLLAGDETAVPAVLATLAQLEPTARGAAFLEVPLVADVQSAVHPEGVRFTWLPREGAAHGALLHAAVLERLGAGSAPVVPDVPEAEVDPELWETPTHSSPDEELEPVVHTVGDDLADVYAWIAGESRLVTGLRRALVRDLGLDRRRVAFMGYWREGRSMGA